MSEELKEILEALKPHDKEFASIKEYYNDNINKYEDLIVKYSKLQEENKNLKLSLKNRIKYSEDLDEKILRIDKAIKYIRENYDNYYGDELYDNYQEIINILTGEDTNEM